MGKSEAEEKARYLVDRLSSMGGFIQEQVENDLISLYPSDVISGIKKYCKSGREILLVADKIIAIKRGISDDCYGAAELIQGSLLLEDEFEKWFLQQNAKAELEALRKAKKKENKYPAVLSRLELKILVQYVEKRMSLEKLQEELECEENDEYIIMFLQYIKKKLERAGYNTKKLDTRLEEENLELNW